MTNPSRPTSTTSAVSIGGHRLPTCEHCNTELRELLTSRYCPNEENHGKPTITQAPVGSGPTLYNFYKDNLAQYARWRARGLNIPAPVPEEHAASESFDPAVYWYYMYGREFGHPREGVTVCDFNTNELYVYYRSRGWVKIPSMGD